MERFDNAKIGDLVYCRLRGDGVITSVTYSERYMLECSFEYEKHTPYDYSGRSSKEHVEPTLFYRKGEERYLEKRPELEIDWSKVPTGPNGVMVKVRDSDLLEFEKPKVLMAYIPDSEYPFYVIKYMHTSNIGLLGFKQAELFEPCKPEWVKR